MLLKYKSTQHWNLKSHILNLKYLIIHICTKTNNTLFLYYFLCIKDDLVWIYYKKLIAVLSKKNKSKKNKEMCV